VPSFRHCLLALLAIAALASLDAAPSVVRVAPTAAGFVLLRDGQPYLPKGAGLPNDGGPEALRSLQQAGANSFRTWGVVDPKRTGALLDEAQRLGLTVCFGIWVEHPGEWVNYRDPATAKRIFSDVARTVRAYQDHPAILMWGIGNELEGYTANAGDDPVVWQFLEFLANAVKTLDPHHPTMTTLAEIAGNKIPNLHRSCPDIDVVGINSYGGLATLPGRYRAADGTKPYLVTEFGPRGAWEAPRTTWQTPLEPTSTAKAEIYRAGYEATVVRDQPGLCLGSYAFLWGSKQETTATWYGMLLKDGSRLAAVDAMQELWTGHAPANRVPVIDALAWRDGDRVAPRGELHAVLTTRDPEADPLAVEWIVRTDDPEVKYGGAAEPEQKIITRAVVASDVHGATIRAPKAPGTYRLFVTEKDGHGGAATGNLPFFVEPAR
jgi:hypothetical protein